MPKQHRKSHKKAKRRIQRGGSVCPSVKNNMVGGGSCQAKNMVGGGSCHAKNMVGGGSCQAKNMVGGSLSSAYVENYANAHAQKQPLDEYKTQMDLPGMNNLKGGGCGCSASAYLKGSKTSKRKMQRGGSMASDSVNMAAGMKKPSAVPGMPAPTAASNIANEPVLYNLTGGNSKSKRRAQRGTKRRTQRRVQRGGSFWNFAGYGNINAGEAMFKNDHFFTKDTSHPSWKDLMDPPTKEKAGSGDKLDLAVGASYPFA